MSEPIPESIPTSADPRSNRSLKRIRGNNTSNPNNRATHDQANVIEFLMLEPERPVNLPTPSNTAVGTSVSAPAEFVANVQGSSAGAGSGEFHVYKASRRREYERLRAMEEESKLEEVEAEWERKERERKEQDEEKTRKNREKRNRRKGKKGAGSSKHPGDDDQDDEGDGEADVQNKKDVKPSGIAMNGVKKALDIPKRADEIGSGKFGPGGSDIGVAQTVKESGIVIHDDD